MEATDIKRGHEGRLNSPLQQPDCNFDNGLCNWTQDDNDQFDWILLNGPSPTLGTGPRADHTSGNGQYIYTDSSILDSAGGTARILSPQIDPGKYCFSFWYFMYGNGDHVDSLLVEQWFQNGTTKEVFKRQGNFGPSWISENITLYSTTDFKIDIRKSVEIYAVLQNVISKKVIFEGSVKNATLLKRDKGDIAVDDVTMISCAENNFLIAVYVLVPVITVVILAIILAVIIWKKRPVKCMKTSHVGKESDKNSANYIGNQNQNIQLDTNAVQQSDYEYTDAKSEQGIREDPVDTPYYSTIDTELAEETDIQQRYENADNSTESEQQTNNQSYDCLNIQE